MGMPISTRIVAADANVSRKEWNAVLRLVCSDLDAELGAGAPDKTVSVFIRGRDFKGKDVSGCDRWQLGDGIHINPGIACEARRYAIVMHEIGHVLGLEHDERPGRLMNLESGGVRGVLTEGRRQRWCAEIRRGLGIGRQGSV